ncbi:TPA: 4-hydroxy-tetrahydrodipicolinate reductase, partial [Campylobacter coli]|nr:4-hydroxy-tetrahydrodipicolinate reductase [Campylobacter coli]
MINIGIYGAKGRMGKQIEECLKSETKAKAAALFDKGDNLEEFFEKSD